jgi:hypothetical protein
MLFIRKIIKENVWQPKPIMSELDPQNDFQKFAKPKHQPQCVRVMLSETLVVCITGSSVRPHPMPRASTVWTDNFTFISDDVFLQGDGA